MINFLKKLSITCYFKIFILVTLFIFVNAISTFTDPTNTLFNVLVLNSYNSSSEWETSIVSNLKENLKDYSNINLNIEYLDARKAPTSVYTEKFLEFLSIKYSDTPIDAIVVLDDEAFDLARKNLNNPISIFYMKPTIFLGINQKLELSSFEKTYITGIMQVEYVTPLLDLIKDIHPSLSSLNVILDNSKYSQIIKETINTYVQLYKSNLNINFIQETYLQDIIFKLKNASDDNSVNLIVGDFKDKFSTKEISTANVMKTLTENFSSPFYTKSSHYIGSGVVGGIVDWSTFPSNIAANMLINLSEGNTVNSSPIVYDNFEQAVFDYDTLEKYNIKPVSLPGNIIFINKGPFEFLLPNEIILLISIFTIFMLALSILLMLNIIKNKKEAANIKIIYDQMKESEKLKTEFIATISHELRTPLNIILNTSKLIDFKLEHDINKKYIKTNLSYIEQNSNRLIRLVNNIIDISKLDSGFINPVFKVLNIVEIVENIVISTVDFVHSQGLDIIFDTTEEEILTSIDEYKIERVILNLLSNAIKFTPTGGSILVETSKINDNVIIRVSDTGIGIPTSELNNIFNKFYQVDSSLSRSNEGSGLGLFIIASLVEMHNGTISVESVENVGTAFTISLPISIDEYSSNNSHIPSTDLREMVKLELSDITNKC